MRSHARIFLTVTQCPTWLVALKGVFVKGFCRFIQDSIFLCLVFFSVRIIICQLWQLFSISSAAIASAVITHGTKREPIVSEFVRSLWNVHTWISLVVKELPCWARVEVDSADQPLFWSWTPWGRQAKSALRCWFASATVQIDAVFRCWDGWNYLLDVDTIILCMHTITTIIITITLNVFRDSDLFLFLLGRFSCQCWEDLPHEPVCEQEV